MSILSRVRDVLKSLDMVPANRVFLLANDDSRWSGGPLILIVGGEETYTGHMLNDIEQTTATVRVIYASEETFDVVDQKTIELRDLLVKKLTTVGGITSVKPVKKVVDSIAGEGVPLGFFAGGIELEIVACTKEVENV